MSGLPVLNTANPSNLTAPLGSRSLTHSLTRPFCHPIRTVLLSALFALCLTGDWNVACSAESAASDGPRWVSGGVTSDERHFMQSRIGEYNLWLVTAVRGGEYLSDVHVAIRDEKGVLVFDQLLDGPWLLLDLPPGLYSVVATSNGQRISRQLRVATGRPPRTHLHFPR